MLVLVLEQLTLLPAAVELDPATTLTLEISEDEYPIVHCTPAGTEPPEVVIVIGTVTLAPGVALPDPTDRVTCCANIVLDTANTSKNVVINN